MGKLNTSGSMQPHFKDHAKQSNKQPIKNKPFDEALDFSGSEASVDTEARKRTRQPHDWSGNNSQGKQNSNNIGNAPQEKFSGHHHNSHEQLSQLIKPSNTAQKVSTLQ